MRLNKRLYRIYIVFLFPFMNHKTDFLFFYLLNHLTIMQPIFNVIFPEVIVIIWKLYVVFTVSFFLIIIKYNNDNTNITVLCRFMKLYIGGTVQRRTAKVGPVPIFKCTPVGSDIFQLDLVLQKQKYITLYCQNVINCRNMKLLGF